MPGPWGRACEELRLQKKLSKATVAKRAGMTATTYGRIEKGQHTQTRKLQAIADVFSVEIDAVLHIQFLQTMRDFGQTAGAQRSIGHGSQAPSVLPSASADEVQALRLQVDVLTEQLAEIAAEREADRQHRRRQRVSTTRVEKSGRPKNARKSRS